MTQPIRQQCYFFHGFMFYTFWKTVSVCLLGGTLLAPPVFAQVIPDQALGKERSQVKTIDAINQRVEGGAARGSNLFHSFLDFNVAEGRGVYFANPQGIESILSRVTGQNPSHILGRLGVLGQADLYLLNPNGIVFGPNASLDIQGSFFGSTANSIALGEEGIFSAVAPQQSQLLSVRPQVGFLNQAADHPGSIINQAQLTTGQDLSLTAGQLDLQGQLRAGGNLTLQAADSLKIRDSETAPFVAAAGNHLLVQGNQSVDILALNHPESGFFSGGDMVLRSANPVGGDAHYLSSGNFQIEELSGSQGDLLSFYDPIIRSQGDVSFNLYQGTSLHILAGGSVNIGTVVITGSDTVGTSVNPVATPALSTVTLSDGTSLIIDGSTQPTLDVRAGIDPSVIGEPLGTLGGTPNNFFNPFPSPAPSPSNNPVATSADIIIGDVFINPPGGTVLLTNQYQPNTMLDGGEITITGAGVFQRAGDLGNGIDARGFGGNGSSVTVDARNSIVLAGSFINTSAVNTGNSGDITLLANQDISIANGGSLQTTTFGQGDGGRIKVDAGRAFSLNNSNIFSAVANQAEGNSNGIDITANSINVTNDSQLTTSTFGQGNGGEVKLQADEAISVDGSSVFSAVANQAVGSSRGIEIKAASFSLSNGQLQSSTFGEGNAGRINIFTEESVSLDEADIDTFIRSNVENGADGNSKGIDINTGALFVRNGAQIQSLIRGTGNSGKIGINARKLISFDGQGSNGFPSGAFSSIEVGGQGNSGGIKINTDSLFITNRAQLSSSTSGRGSPGDITIDARTEVSLLNSIIISEVSERGGRGEGGKININTGSLFLRDGSSLLADTENIGNAGAITIIADDKVLLEGMGRGALNSTEIVPSRISTMVESNAVGQGGEVSISTGLLSLNDGGFISSSTFGTGNKAQGGDIRIMAKEVSLADQSFIGARSQGLGNAGNIALNIEGRFNAVDSDITTSANQTSGGAISVKAGDIRLFGDSDISTRVGSGAGTGGDIDLTADSIIALDDSDILAFARDGRGGDITLNTPAFFGENFFGVILTGVDPDTLDGNDRVDLNATGQTSGIVTVPDVSFIQNNLTELPENLVNPENLLANSCIVRTADQEQGKFIVTGPGGLPKRPGDAPLSSFPTGTVQTPTNSPTSPQSNHGSSWQSGESIVEPQGVYQLKNGRLVISRECPDL